jgi:endoplasmic reticulum-Golgi intermediate compartment protein 3
LLQLAKVETAADPNYCGPCYGAETEITKCCNTCDELKHAYEAKGWNTNVIVRNSSQCLKDVNNPFANVRPGEGCRVSGSMTVNKVAGNFHMTLGESIVRDGAHIHQFVPSEAPGFNVSHTIHSLSFGQTYVSMPPNPLDNSASLS